MHIAYAGFLLWNRMNTLSFWNTNISPLLSLYAKFNSRFRANNYRVQKFFYRIKVNQDIINPEGLNTILRIFICWQTCDRQFIGYRE